MIIAIDIGATKTLVGQFIQGTLKHTARFLTPTNPEAFMQLLHAHLAPYTGIKTISVAVPGILAPDGTILRCGTLPWHHFSLKQNLERIYRCEVLIENDAKLGALYEINLLPATPALGVYLTFSTGIGIGIILDGKLAPQLDASEAGHMALWFDGRFQPWQDFASGRAVAQHFGKQAQDFIEPKEWVETSKRISIGLHALIPTLQPDIIVFGGGLGGYFARFEQPLIQEIKQHLSPYIRMPQLKVANYPNEAVLYGCHYYVTHHPARNRS